jgi:hypothetical protein
VFSRKVHAILVAAVLGLAVLTVSGRAEAGVGRYCGHGSTSHWHLITYNVVTYVGYRNYYSGSELVHEHKYDNAYVAPGQPGWNEDEKKLCPRH